MKPCKIMVYLKSPDIPTNFTILPQIFTDLEPILGEHRICVEVNNPTLWTAAKRSGMKIYEYLSTIYNLEYIKEKGYRDLLQRRFGGVVEVPVPKIGRIDVLTSNKIIEVKSLKRWKQSIGQILCYGYFYPHHQKVIALTPCKHNYDINLIKSICKSLNIEVLIL